MSMAPQSKTHITTIEAVRPINRLSLVVKTIFEPISLDLDHTINNDRLEEAVSYHCESGLD